MKQMTAAAVVKVLYPVFMRFGCPTNLLTDNETALVSLPSARIAESFMKILGALVNVLSVYVLCMYCEYKPFGLASTYTYTYTLSKLCLHIDPCLTRLLEKHSSF
eukprot:GHVS01079254.1.p2 GENE.GHVS01079254.1~~GHVS01079254.1.p2  ORF type:complete len:105 (-),score=8.45 GHVS01079254.1:224-538(-)